MTTPLEPPTHDPLHQTSTKFFTYPKESETRYVYTLSITVASDFYLHPDPASEHSKWPGLPRNTESLNHGAFLSAETANWKARDWLFEELASAEYEASGRERCKWRAGRHGHWEKKDGNDEENQINMWPGFWVPEGLHKVVMRKQGGLTDIKVTIGYQNRRKIHHIQVIEQELDWEYDDDNNDGVEEGDGDEKGAEKGKKNTKTTSTDGRGRKGG